MDGLVSRASMIRLSLHPLPYFGLRPVVIRIGWR
jgi:hypothetical protein